MDILIVCGVPSPGGAEYALGLVLGLVIDVALCAHYRFLARRPARRHILPLT